MTLTPDDSLARSLYSPKDSLGVTAGIPQLKKLYEQNLQFNTENNRKESVNCLRLFGDNSEAKCHEVGLLKQEADNAKIRAIALEKGKEPTVRTYIGYTFANNGEVTAATVSFGDPENIKTISFTVTNVREQNNDAHCNVEMVISSEEDGSYKKFIRPAKEKISACFDDNFVQHVTA